MIKLNETWLEFQEGCIHREIMQGSRPQRCDLGGFCIDPAQCKRLYKNGSAPCIFCLKDTDLLPRKK